MLRSVREFVRPIPDEALPDMTGTKLRGLSLSAFIFWLLAPTNVGAVFFEGLRGNLIAWRAVIAIALNSAVYGTIIASARTRWVRAHPDVPLLVLAAVVMGDLVCAGVICRDGHNESLIFAVVLPLVFAVFTRWQPRMSLVLGAFATALILVAKHTFAPTQQTTGVIVYASIGTALGAALASQVQRRSHLELERMRHELQASERLSSLGKMTAELAHELKSPLATAMNGLATCRELLSELKTSIGHEDVEEADLHAIGEEIGVAVVSASAGVERATRMIQDVRSQTMAMHETTYERFVVGDVVSRTLELVELARDRPTIAVDALGLDTKVACQGDATKLGQIVMNLVVNALEACALGQGSRVTVSVFAERGGFRIVVDDDGPGVPLALRRRIFDPLFSTKLDGVGLGLCLARDLAESAFSGSLVLVPKEERGACFEMWGKAAPMRRTPSVAWAPSASASARPSAKMPTRRPSEPV